MNPPVIASLLIAGAMLTLQLAGQPAPSVAKPAPAWPYREKLAMVQRAVLPGVAGRLDHLAIDVSSNTLYVAALRNNSLEAVHVPGGIVSQSIPDLPEPAGVVFMTRTRRLVVACSGDNTVRVFKVDAQGKLSDDRTVDFLAQVDTLAADDAAGRMYVRQGATIASFNVETGERGTDIPIGGDPEGMIVEPGDTRGGKRLFVNVPSKLVVAVVDLEKGAVSSELSLTFAEGRPPREDERPGPILNIIEGNYPIALDAERKRLFVATRVPECLVVFDTDTGRRVAVVQDICKDADDCWYDAATRRVLVSGGGGTGAVSGIAQTGADEYALEFTVTTSSGARTSVLAPEQRRMYVASPRLGDDQAYIFVYQIAPR